MYIYTHNSLLIIQSEGNKASAQRLVILPNEKFTACKFMVAYREHASIVPMFLKSPPSRRCHFSFQPQIQLKGSLPLESLLLPSLPVLPSHWILVGQSNI